MAGTVGGGGSSFDDEVFDGLILDEDFVRGAEIREPSARDRRLQRIAAEHSRLQDQDLAERRAARRANRPVRRGWARLRTVRLRSALVIVALLASLLWLDLRSPSPGGDALSGFGGIGFEGDVISAGLASMTNLPPPSPEQRDSPIGTPAPLPADTGPYRFMHVQSNDDSGPVAYDPCRPIHFVVNDRTAPPGADTLLRDAIAKISQATGLQFIDDGATDEAPVLSRAAYLPDVYPDRWAPVLIAWTDETEVGRLAGSVAGAAGSTALQLSGEAAVYVSGGVVLDGPQLAALLEAPNGNAHVGAVILHELGHVVGLHHVDDESQIMHDTGSEDVTDLAAGDLIGLHHLGRGRCFPDI